jgi:phthalate 4,5-cis-dihydrodiol dehydrogenase
MEAFNRDLPAETYSDLEGLCASSNVDVIYIATPTHLHTKHTLMAAANAKHVIVEKPMALTLDEAMAMIDASRHAGVHLVVGHSQSFEPPIRAMRDLVRSGTLGRVGMLHNWQYTDWLYRPRTPSELETALGGGVVFRQGAHQVDLLRWIAGGLVRSVRAATGFWDQARPTEGSHAFFLDFEDGAFATAVFSGYGHFKATELSFDINEAGHEESIGPHSTARERLRFATNGAGEVELKRSLGYGRAAAAPAHHSFYGLTIVSCERGDIRQSENGLYLYGNSGKSEISLPVGETGRDALVHEAYQAVIHGRPPQHDGSWGMANLEVCLAALESARTRQEVRLRYQVPTPDQ